MAPAKNADNWAAMLSNKSYWGCYFLFVVTVTVAGIGYFGGVAHFEIPPLCDFVTPDGEVVISADMINHGEEVFHIRGLMVAGMGNLFLLRILSGGVCCGPPIGPGVWGVSVGWPKLLKS